MESGAWAPLAVLATSGIAGVLIFFVAEEARGLRTVLNMAAASIKVVLIAFIVWGVVEGGTYEARFSFVQDFDLLLRIDELSLLFAGLSATLWFFTTIYAIGYLEDSPGRSRFFGFFSLCVTASMGIAFAGNWITFVVFYEMLTLTTYPLVVHRGTEASLAAGRKYLIYTLTGGTALLVATVWLHVLAGPVEFSSGGALGEVEGSDPQLTAIFALMIASLGVKAAIVPLHGWLPVAMVAPAPVSALLHAVAVVKAGAFGIVRVVYDTYGLPLADSLNVLLPLAVVASFTIIYGSVRALQQADLKRRLAFSTVSQLAYITLGTALIAPVATTGAFVHLVHQGMMKVTLFFCAGILAETVGVRRVDSLDGMARCMPVTMTAFTVAALGMIGLPPTVGFVTKWYLGTGGLESGEGWVLLVLATSSALNAAYFLPPVYAAWFKPLPPHIKDHRRGRLEANWTLLLPAVATAGFALAAGILANMPYSPLDLADLVVAERYGP